VLSSRFKKLKSVSSNYCGQTGLWIHYDLCRHHSPLSIVLFLQGQEEYTSRPQRLHLSFPPLPLSLTRLLLQPKVHLIPPSPCFLCSVLHPIFFPHHLRHLFSSIFIQSSHLSSSHSLFLGSLGRKKKSSHLPSNQ
jgi:hypothetical protein